MNKSTIATLLLAVAAATGMLYALGIFDNPSSSVTVQTKPLSNVPLVTTTTTTTVATPSTPSSTAVPSTTVSVQQQIQTAPAPASSASALTSAKVAQHATRNDCWMIISGNVYDLTSYLPMHPAGQEVILDWCGTDGTKAFVDVRKHSRSNVQAELATYLVGVLE